MAAERGARWRLGVCMRAVAVYNDVCSVADSLLSALETVRSCRRVHVSNANQSLFRCQPGVHVAHRHLDNEAGIPHFVKVPRLHTGKEVVISLLSLKERLSERIMVCVDRHDRIPCVSQFIAFKRPLDLKLVREPSWVGGNYYAR
jgi:hypothetical protein